ncbi:GAF domain-containing protein [Roseovarius litoreus]|uniref:GAF domain-containing protein n=1 Tax=Roseovarius litoreus TaxID=1155722 RepID=A0A1M7EA85_9RHOB|nr:GAF domain-containing protein [Roseovarius litoreus]SHL88540.1 GAF domain-containing protein [Roseovarius litoreus]
MAWRVAARAMLSMTQHIERVLGTLSSGSAAARSRLAASWHRSFRAHGLDPAHRREVRQVTGKELRDRRDAQGAFLEVAAPQMDSLFGLIGRSGCGVLLTDAEGVVLELRCADGDAQVFRDWGLRPGADWSEAAEGTNGIGTCLAENRQVTIHRDQHFLARNIGMSCMDAPIHGPDGALIAALDVSSARADQTEAFNGLIAAMVAQTARQIEADAFRAAYAGRRIVVAGEAGQTEPAALLAVDDDDLIVGATRGARRAYGLPLGGALSPVPAGDILGREGAARGFERAERAAVMRALARAGGNVSEAARALGVGRATLYRRMARLEIAQGDEGSEDLSRN